MPTHLVSLIDVKDFGSEALRIGDLNGDGAPDLLFIQSIYGTREITCLTAATIFGEVLWQAGTPSVDNGFTYSDLPVQIYDWDGDGRNEVLYIRQAHYAECHLYGGYARERAVRYEGEATLIILDAGTGKEKHRIALPAPADDCILFADLTGRGRRQDLVVKDRYWNMWGISHEGQVLWHWQGSTGHFPAVGDYDGDGRDEVFVGFALVDHDGTTIFQHDDGGHHQDACCAVQTDDGTWRLLFGNHGLHCLSLDGAELWTHPLAEAQHVVPGHFRTDSSVQFMVIDRGQPRTDGERSPAVLYLFDIDGQELWRREQPEGSWCSACVKINWSGQGTADDLLVYGRAPVVMRPRGAEQLYCRGAGGAPDAIFDGDGHTVDTFEMQYMPYRDNEEGRSGCCYDLAADVWGDGRDEVIQSSARGACIHANARPLADPTLYNETLYPGE